MSMIPHRAWLCAGLVLAAAAASAPAGVLANDLAAIAFLQPASGCALTSTENVTLRLFNYGAALPPASSFNVSYSINAGPPVTEMIVLPSPLLTDSSFDYMFTTQANLSTPGTYSFAATVSLAGDTNPANDSLTGHLVTSDAVSNAGTLGGTTTGSSGTLTLSGTTGAVIQWEESDDGGQRWFALANATTSQSFANVRTATKFRARVANGVCPDAISNAVTVTP